MQAPLRRLGKNLSWLTLGNLASRGAILLLLILAARGWGVAAVGVLTVALAAALVAVPLFAAGQVEVLIRETARQPERALPLLAAARRDQRRLLHWGLPAALVASLLVPDAPLRWTLLALVPYVLLRVEAMTGTALFAGLDRMEIDTAVRTIELVTALALTAAAIGLGLPVWSTGLALAAGAGLSLLWLRRRLQRLPGGGESASAPPSLLPQSLPFLGQGVVLALLLRADTLLMDGFGVPREEIGHYGVAAAVVWGLLAAAQLLALSLYPTFSRHAAAGRQPPRAAAAAAAAGLGLGTAGAVAVWLLAEPLVAVVFGAAFLPSLPLLQRLAWALPAASASMVMGVVVAAWRRQHRGFLLLALTLAVSLALNLLWIPHHGALGAATAALAAHGFGALGHLAVAAWPVGAEAAALAPQADEP